MNNRDHLVGRPTTPSPSSGGEATHIWKDWPVACSWFLSNLNLWRLPSHVSPYICEEHESICDLISKYDLTNCCPLWWRKVLTYQCLSPERGSLWGRSGSIEALSDPTTALGSQSDTHDTHGDVTNISSTYGFAEWYIWWYITDIYVLACQMELFKYLNWQGAHMSSFCAPSPPSATGRCWFVDYFWLQIHFSNLSDAKRPLAFYIS